MCMLSAPFLVARQFVGRFHLASTETPHSNIGDAESVGSATGTRSSHRYLCEKHDRACKERSCSPNTIRAGPLSLCKYRVWPTGDGEEADGVWCKQCYTVITVGGFLDVFHGDMNVFLADLKVNHQLIDELHAALAVL